MLFVFCALLAGCGGGSGGGTGNTVTQITVNGTLVDDITGNGISDFTVNINGVQETTTKSSPAGSFTFTIPSTTLAQTPTLTIDNTSGVVVYSTQILPSEANSSGVVTLPTIPVSQSGGPPNPPGGLGT